MLRKTIPFQHPTSANTSNVNIISLCQDHINNMRTKHSVNVIICGVAAIVLLPGCENMSDQDRQSVSGAISGAIAGVSHPYQQWQASPTQAPPYGDAYGNIVRQPIDGSYQDSQPIVY
jgi:hypothetical protein